MKTLIAALALLLPAQEVSLFDGTTLAGWEGDAKTWKVRDGAIVGGSLEGNARNEFLVSAKPYADFVLRLEYKLVGTEGFINGGVQVRSKRIPKPPNEMSGYQADIGKGYSGSLYDESRRNKMIAKADPEVVAKAEKPGEWNRYEIRCEGPRIRLSINGVQTVDYTEAEANIEKDGFIGLQIHGGCKAEISFRAISIEDLSKR